MDEPESAEASPEPIPPPAGMRWFARIMGWLCWFGIATAIAINAIHLFDWIPPGVTVTESDREYTLLGSAITIEDPSAPDATAGLRRDPLFLSMGLVPAAFLIWALVSAYISFRGVSRGEYFSRSTILGLRNLALAVLLYMTVAPLATMIARLAYLSRFEHGSFSIMIGLNTGVILMLIFAAVVALVSTVMAHAARLADENRQFI